MNRKISVGLWLAILLLACVSPLTARKWTDRFGQTAEGKYIRLFGNQVVIQRGARIIMVPLQQLCDEDQAYVLEQVKKEPKKIDGNRGTLPLPKSPPRALREAEGKSAEENDPNNPFLTPGKEQPEAADAPPSKPKYPERIWIDVNGCHLPARFVELREGKVVLDADGMELAFSPEVFSPGDLAYIKQVTGRSDSGQPDMASSNPAAPPPSNLYPVPSDSGSPSSNYSGPNVPPSTDPWAEMRRAEAAQREARQQERLRQQQEAEQQRQQQAEMQRQQEAERQRQQAQNMGRGTFPGGSPGISPPRGPSYVPEPSVPQYQIMKIYKCSRCDKQVSDPKLGGKCPHCGAIFMYEKDQSGKVVKSIAGTYTTVFFGIAALICGIVVVAALVKLVNR